MTQTISFDFEQTVRFLSTLYGGIDSDCPVEIRSIDYKGAPSVFTFGPQEARDYIEKWGHKASICVGMARRKKDAKSGKAEDLAFMQFLWVDIDCDKAGRELDKETVLETLKDAYTPDGASFCPDVIVDSGGGFHAYWRLTEPLDVDGNVDEIKAALAGLARVFGGDPAVVDVARVMRIPGTIHQKRGKLLQLVHVSDDPGRYEFDDVVEWCSELRPMIELPAAPEMDDKPANAFEAHGELHGVADRLDVETALGEMSPGDTHRHLVSISMSLANAGWEPERIAGFLVDKVREIPQSDGKPRNIKAEAKEIRAMVKGAFDKIRKEAAEQRERQQASIDAQSEKMRAAQERAAKEGGMDTLTFKTHSPQYHGKEIGKIKTKPTLGNAMILIESVPEFKDGIWYDNFTNQVMADPYVILPVSSPFPVTDYFENRFAIHCEHEYGMVLPDNLVTRAINTVAKDNERDTLVSFLDGLEWDGVERADRLFQDYFVCEGAPVVLVECARLFLHSAVARAYVPGCAADDMVILRGRQGIGKSRGIRALTVRDEFFMDNHIDMKKTKEAQEAIAGKWIIENSELSGQRGNTVEIVKNFISNTVCRYRKPWGKRAEDYPRRCVLIGTTNSDQFLNDTTGNRRFWPLGVESVDVDLLREDGKQIWAEVVHRYRSWPDFKWHCDDHDALYEIEEAREEAQEEHYLQHLTERFITCEPRLEDNPSIWNERTKPLEYFESIDIIIEYLGVQGARSIKHYEREIIRKELGKLGWEYDRRTVDGERKRGFFPAKIHKVRLKHSGGGTKWQK